VNARWGPCPVCCEEGAAGHLVRVPGRVFVHCPHCDVRWAPLPESTEALPFDLTHYTAKQEVKGWSFEAGVREYLRLFEELPHAPGERFLEIGPGNGEVLEAARRLGLRCTGFDVDPTALDGLTHLRDVRLVHGQLTPERFPEGPFDIIFSNNVIEHIPKPIDFLARLRALLAPHGRLWVSCPNVASYEAQILGSYWPQYAPQDHVRLYSPTALRAVLERAGLAVERVWTQEGSFDFPLTMLAGARNFLVRHRAPGAELTAREYGGGAAVPSDPARQLAMRLVYQVVPLCGIPFAWATPRFGVAQHLRALARAAGCAPST